MAKRMMCRVWGPWDKRQELVECERLARGEPVDEPRSAARRGGATVRGGMSVHEYRRRGGP